jgi:transcriptional regulator with PAS, ATPase and Fis domain
MVDSAPIVLGFTFGLAGVRGSRLVQLTAQLEATVAQRTAELVEVNTELQRENIEHNRAKAIISQGKREWEATFDAVKDLIVAVNTEGEIIRCNRSTSQHFTTTYQAIIGRHLGEVFFTDSDQAV